MALSAGLTRHTYFAWEHNRMSPSPPARLPGCGSNLEPTSRVRGLCETYIAQWMSSVRKGIERNRVFGTYRVTWPRSSVTTFKLTTIWEFCAVGPTCNRPFTHALLTSLDWPEYAPLKSAGLMQTAINRKPSELVRGLGLWVLHRCVREGRWRTRPFGFAKKRS
jgi:hypothetical protein